MKRSIIVIFSIILCLSLVCNIVQLVVISNFENEQEISIDEKSIDLSTVENLTQHLNSIDSAELIERFQIFVNANDALVDIVENEIIKKLTSNRNLSAAYGTQGKYYINNETSVSVIISYDITDYNGNYISTIEDKNFERIDLYKYGDFHIIFGIENIEANNNVYIQNMIRAIEIEKIILNIVIDYIK